MKKTSEVKNNTFDVFLLDMIQEEKGVWSENDRHKLGRIVVSAADEALEESILKAMAEFMVKPLFGVSYPALETTDRRRVYCEDYYSSGDWFEVGAVKEHKPIYGLARVVE